MNNAEAAAAIDYMRKTHGVKSDVPIGIKSSFPERFAEEPQNPTDIILRATTASIDLDGEVVVPRGVRADSYFFRNKSVFVDHRYEYTMLAAKYRSHVFLTLTSGVEAINCRVRMCNPINDLRRDIIVVARESGIASSIGFAPDDVGKPNSKEVAKYKQADKEPESIVRTWNWLELSFTAIPMNVDCQSQAVTMDEKALNRIDDLVTKSRIRRETAVLLGLPITPKRKYHAVLT